MREGRFGHAVDDGEQFGVLHPPMYDNYGAPRHVDASGQDNRWNCHTLMFHFCAPRKGATGDGAIVMVVSEVDARAFAVVGDLRIRTMEAVMVLMGLPSCKFDQARHFFPSPLSHLNHYYSSVRRVNTGRDSMVYFLLPASLSSILTIHGQAGHGASSQRFPACAHDALGMDRRASLEIAPV